MTSSDALPAFHLAAMASAAIDGLRISRVGESTRTEDLSTAALVDEKGSRYRVVAAHTAESGMTLLTESRILQLMSAFAEKGLTVARPAGRYSQGTLAAVVYHDDDEAAPLDEGDVEGDAAVRFLIGQAIAKIHLVPASRLEDAGLPFLEAHEVRERKLNLLDSAAGTGRVPAVLLSRWENVLDEAGLWRFTPTPVHGDLHEDRFAREGDGLRVTGWSCLSVGDPAEDFAWIMSLPAESRQQIFNAYYISTATQGHPRDVSMEKRALFHAEFAVAEYLMTAVRQQDDARLETATALLGDLARRLESAAESAAKTAAAQSPTTQGASAESPADRRRLHAVPGSTRAEKSSSSSSGDASGSGRTDTPAST